LQHNADRWRLFPKPRDTPVATVEQDEDMRAFAPRRAPMRRGLWFGFTGVLLYSLSASAQIRINEIRTDDSEADTDEYFELAGPPNASTAGYWYVVLGDLTGLGSGVVEFAWSIADASPALSSTGLLVQELVGMPCNPAIVCPCIGSGCISPFVVCGIFENNDNVTHLLVTNFTGIVGDDLDTDDDGILDVTPWSQIEDSVALFDSPTSELMYSTTQVGPDPNTGGQPWHVFYCETAGWTIGTASPECVSDSKGDPNPECDPVSVDDRLSSWGRIKSHYR
jgi:hypothetical protein